MKRILSIDGGGIRGLIPAVVCQYIEEQARQPIYELFDLIAGTSTGGIIAMGLVLPPRARPASDLVALYQNDGPTIFSAPRGIWQQYFRGPKFTNVKLEAIMRESFGNALIGDALKEVLVTSYDITYRQLFNVSRRMVREEPNAKAHMDDFLMWKIAMGTSAAPTYFSPWSFGDRFLIDGGVVANNPACLAMAEAHLLWPDEEIILVSLGTGTLTTSIEQRKAANWGLIGWARPAIDCMFDGTAKATETFLNQTMVRHDRYWRFQCGLAEQTEAMDGVDIRAINGLIILAQNMIRDNSPRFSKLIELLKQSGTKPAPPPAPEAVDTLRLLSGIEVGVRKSLSIQNRIFGLGVNSKLAELYRAVTDWEKGIIIVPPEDGGRFLVDLYGEAKESVFSTRLKQFSGTFYGSSLPDDILNANRKARVPTTRVFVFDAEADVSPFDYREMIRQQAAGIDVRVLIRSNAPITGPIADFTIIDKLAVGVTEFAGPRAAAARWTFDDEMAFRPFLDMKQQLLSKSVKFSEFVSQATERRTKYSLWTDHELVNVSENNIECYQHLSRRFFGKDAADDARVLSIQRQIGRGIYVLQRVTEVEAPSAGILCLVPVSFQGFRRLDAEEVTGSELNSDDILGPDDTHAPGYYLGAIGGIDMRANGALVDSLKGFVHELRRGRVQTIFARPVTDDGLRLLQQLHWKGPDDRGEPLMRRVCRLQLR
jgi:predicted acylesterase/phospholipase RssA